MSELFGERYGAAYDTIYQEKDYAAECDMIEAALRLHGDGPSTRLLDLGCGTGNHAIPLAKRGHAVVGVDRSPHMLEQARAKLEQGLDLRLVEGDVRHVRVDAEFDAALMMFAVLGYQLENADVLAALATARRHLRPGGLFICDVWYGPTVMSERPTTRTRRIPLDDGFVLRTSSGVLDGRRQRVAVHFHLVRVSGGRLVAETEETHEMRFFFPLELELFLESSGFRLLSLTAFPTLDVEPDDATWNVLVVARAV